MAAPSNQYKIGLFVVVGFGAAILAAVLFGSLGAKKETIKYHTYFNESVQGLDLGSPVKFRGVTIGHVSDIEIAPDHRMVDVVSELDTHDIKRMGLTEAGASPLGPPRFAIPPDLRAQIGSQGITGVKFIAIDFFDVKSNPPPELPFKPQADRYIPATPSVMKNLEETILKALERLSEIGNSVTVSLGRVDRLLAKLEEGDLSGHATSTLRKADQTMSTLQAALTHIDQQDLGPKAGRAMADIDIAVNNMNKAIEHLDGLLASVKGVSDALGEMARNGRGTQRDFEATLRDVSDAADAMRTLAESLDRDPDMLIKGKTKVKGSK
jgi:phospholipid/cholesterol/gamma-HCH transport system substrate-binding protein